MKNYGHLSCVSHPSAEPCHLDVVKASLNVVGDYDDVLISRLLTTAREAFENETQRCLVVQDWQWHSDYFPSEIEIRRTPLISVNGITYVDSAGDSQELESDDFQVDFNKPPHRITPAYGEYWPSNRCVMNAVTVDLTLGHVTPFTADSTSGVLTSSGRVLTNGESFRLSNSGGALPAPLSGVNTYYAVNVDDLDFQLSLTEGGDPITLTDEGSGLHFIGTLPQMAVEAILLLVGDLYDQREATGQVSEENAWRWRHMVNACSWTF